MAVQQNRWMGMKMIIIGGLVASLLYCVFWAVKYVFDGHIKASDDMMQLAGISQLGKITTDKVPSFFVDRWIFGLKHHGQRLMDADRSIELIASVIAVTAKSQKIEKIAFAGCLVEGKTGEYCKKLTDLLKDTYQIEATILDDVIYNQNDVKALAESKSVVLIETAGTSLYNDFYKEIQLIKQLDINTLGGVIVA